MAERVDRRDPRVRYRLRRGENPSFLDKRLGVTLALVIVGIVVVLLISGIRDAPRPDGTVSDESFGFSQDCGGAISATSVEFDRLIHPKPLLDTILPQRRDSTYPVYAFVDLRDDHGKVASNSWYLGQFRHGDIDSMRSVEVTGQIALDGPVVGQLQCIASSSFDPGGR